LEPLRVAHDLLVRVAADPPIVIDKAPQSQSPLRHRSGRPWFHLSQRRLRTLRREIHVAAIALLNWIKNGRIRPVPRKKGREYFCRPDAEYVDPIAEKIERMIGGR
jgi:hypothetical protein